MMRNFSATLFIILSLILLQSCGGGVGRYESVSVTGDTLSLSDAQMLTIVDYSGEYTEVEIRNPWNPQTVLHRYILIDRQSSIPSLLPEGTIVRTPIDKALVYSSVHQSLIEELGSDDAIAGICDAKYVESQRLRERLLDGSLVDCGNSYTPDIERIIHLSPDAVMLSPSENSGNYGKLGTLGIPIIECADYMESTPLGRAEWIRFYGRLLGKATVADELFDSISCRYRNMSDSVCITGNKPKVILDRMYNGTWYVPGEGSVMTSLIRDAGGINPFSDISKGSSVPLSIEQILATASDADIWLIRYSGDRDLTFGDLKSENAAYAKIAAFKGRRIYGCNTTKIPYHNEVPFHPERLLSDISQIINHERLLNTDSLRYFTPLCD